jgi:hypothetical protein
MLEPHVENMIAHFTNGLNLRCDVTVFTNTSVSSVCPCRCRQLAADAAIRLTGSSGVATALSVYSAQCGLGLGGLGRLPSVQGLYLLLSLGASRARRNLRRVSAAYRSGPKY